MSLTSSNYTLRYLDDGEYISKKEMRRRLIKRTSYLPSYIVDLFKIVLKETSLGTAMQLITKLIDWLAAIL